MGSLEPQLSQLIFEIQHFNLKIFSLFKPLFSFSLQYIYIYLVHINFLVTCMKIFVTQKVEIDFFQFLVKCIQCLISNKIFLFSFKIMKFNFLCWSFAMCGKITLIFQNYFLGKIYLLSHHIMRKQKKGRKRVYPPFSATPQPHPRNNSLKKKSPHPSQYHLIKLLNFSSSLKPWANHMVG
jgi:hypothetical protein